MGRLIDFPAAVRGASAGFSVLVIGGLLGPMLGSFNPVAGVVTLVLTALIAFVVAARKPGQAAHAGLHGAIAASASYLLVLPLVLRVESGRDPANILLTLAAAIAVGALTATVAAQAARPTRSRPT